MAANSSQFSTKSVIGIAAILALFVVTVWLSSGLGGDEELTVSQSGDQPPTAAELREQEAEALSTYGWIDQEKGVVRIPVDRATELLIEELNQ